MAINLALYFRDNRTGGRRVKRILIIIWLIGDRTEGIEAYNILYNISHERECFWIARRKSHYKTNTVYIIRVSGIHHDACTPQSSPDRLVRNTCGARVGERKSQDGRKMVKQIRVCTFFSRIFTAPSDRIVTWTTIFRNTYYMPPSNTHVTLQFITSRLNRAQRRRF